MSRFRGRTPVYSRYLALGAASLAVGLHAAVVGALMGAQPVRSAPEMLDSVEIRFVELSDVVQDAAPSESESETLVQSSAEEPVLEPEPEPILEPEPIPEPELIPEPEPIPEP